MQASCWLFWLPCGCGGTTRGASPNGAHPGLHGKLLDAAIGQVPAPYRPGATMVDIFFDNTQSTIKTPFLASNYGTIQSLVVYENFSPKTKPPTYSAHWCNKAAYKCETARFELECSAKFLAIKRCQWTNIKKVIKLARSSSKSWARICARRSKAVSNSHTCPPFICLLLFCLIPPSVTYFNCQWLIPTRPSRILLRL